MPVARLAAAAAALVAAVASTACGDDLADLAASDDLDFEPTSLDGCPHWSPDGRSFAFVRGPGGQSTIGPGGSVPSFVGDVYVSNGAASEVRRVTRSREREAVIGWLARPPRVVFVRDTVVFAQAPELGARPQRLARLGTGESALMLSRGGRFLAVSGIEDLRLYVVRVASGERSELASGYWSGGAFAERAPRIAFVSEERGVEVVDLESETRISVSEGYLGDTPTLTAYGEKVAYAEPAVDPDDALSAVNQIHVAELAEDAVAKKRRLTAIFDVENTSPVFSPSGRVVVYQSGGDLRSVRVDGTGDRQLTSAGGYGDGCPAFSPDGRRIAFIREIGGGCCSTGSAGVVVMSADGSGKRAVPRGTPRGSRGQSLSAGRVQ